MGYTNICDINTGKKEYSVVCGAKNVKIGLRTVFAGNGTFIPGKNFTLESKNIRGVTGDGMLCSEEELNISNNSEGIIELDIKYKFKQIDLKKIFLKLLNKNNILNGIIYLQVTRGVQYREHKYEDKIKPTLIIYTRNKKFNLPGKNFKGVNTITHEDLRWKRRDIKTVNLLPNIIAANKAKKMKAYEAILLQNGKVTEGTSSNIWIIKKNNLITHPANTDILKGVTRTSILKILRKTSLKLVEKSFTREQLLDADEVFLTSSGSFITPILKIDKKKINNGKIGNITLKLAEMYSKSCMHG